MIESPVNRTSTPGLLASATFCVCSVPHPCLSLLAGFAADDNRRDLHFGCRNLLLDPSCWPFSFFILSSEGDSVTSSLLSLSLFSLEFPASSLSLLSEWPEVLLDFLTPLLGEL